MKLSISRPNEEGELSSASGLHTDQGTYPILGELLVVSGCGIRVDSIPQLASIIRLTRCPEVGILTFDAFLGLTHTLSCVDPGAPSLEKLSIST